MPKRNKKVVNKKVRNATPMVYEGIQFRSKIEVYTYRRLKEEGIETDYEQTQFELMPAFEYNDQKIRPIRFKPDFVSKDKSFIIECKGFPNGAYPLREKLFKYLLYNTYGSTGPRMYTVKNQKQVEEAIKDIKENG